MGIVSSVWGDFWLLYLITWVSNAPPFWVSNPDRHPNTSDATSKCLEIHFLFNSTYVFAATLFSTASKHPLFLLFSSFILFSTLLSSFSSIQWNLPLQVHEGCRRLYHFVLAGQSCCWPKHWGGQRSIVGQVHHRLDVPLFTTSVHGGTGTENIDYRIQVIMRGLILSDVMYLAICSDRIWSWALWL